MKSVVQTVQLFRPTLYRRILQDAGAIANSPAPRLRYVHRSASSSAVLATGSGQSRPSWDVRMLYDGECPLCMKEVDFLRRRDAGKNKIDFVDIASPSYTAEDNAGITYETAMQKIHAITADGRIITGLEVFRSLYNAVGLGYVYALTQYEPIGRAAEALYNVWAKYRMEVTGRETLSILLAKRNAADPTVMCKVNDTADACKEKV